jgi:hypothetical protein
VARAAVGLRFAPQEEEIPMADTTTAISGNLTADIELRLTSDGTAVAARCAS